jgi:hypothetical protein
MTEPADFTVAEAQPEDAPAIATIHLTSRQQAMPYLRRAHTDDENGIISPKWWEIAGRRGGWCAITGKSLPTC